MKTLILPFVIVSLFACGLRSSGSGNKPAGESLAATPDDCTQAYQHKSQDEIAAMSPAQRLEEMVNEQIYHYPAFGDETAELISNYILKDGVKIQPQLIEFMNQYDPGAPPKCNDNSGVRFEVASSYASSLDHTSRLRATDGGLQVIRALERGVARMKKAGFDNSDHNLNARFNLSQHHLDMARGTNIRDEMIRATLLARHKVQMGEGEYLEFSNYLTSIDPAYPTWSEVGEAGPPALMKESKRYYEAYLRFKKKN